MSIDLFLVRHGETQSNRERRYQGQTDTMLSTTGKFQARRLAASLQAIGAHQIISSDLTRALHTAQAVGRACQLEVSIDPRLREIGFGQWQGMTVDEIQERFPESLAAYRQDPLTAVIPGGESPRQVLERVMKALGEIERDYEGQRVIVVSHGGVLRSAVCGLLQLDLRHRQKFAFSNGSLTHVRVTPRGALIVKLNDTSHFLRHEYRGGRANTDVL